MTEAEVATYIGLLFGAWALGWGSGFLMYTVKRMLDFI